MEEDDIEEEEEEDEGKIKGKRHDLSISGCAMLVFICCIKKL